MAASTSGSEAESRWVAINLADLGAEAWLIYIG